MLTIRIDTDNAAFGETPDDRNAELARIVREISRNILTGSFTYGSETIRDVNGNDIGEWRVSADRIDRDISRARRAAARK